MIPNWPTLLDSNKFELKDGDKVLDSGAGTAVWLREIASSVPKSMSVEFQGIDITSSKFPKPEDIPSNVTLSLKSVQNLPEEWENTFALVHQTFLIVALRREEWLSAVQEVERVLQPGGWLTFGEPGHFRSCGPKTKILEDLLVAFYAHCSIDRFIIDQLPEILSSTCHSLDRASIKATHYKLHLCGKRPDLAGSPEHRQLVQDGMWAYVAVFRHMREVMFDKAALAVEPYCKTIADFDKLMDDVEEEWENATEGYIEFIVLSAQKLSST
jgi:SAM-dependent methyltransferase